MSKKERKINQQNVTKNKRFADLFEWLGENRLSIHFGEALFLFGSKYKINKAEPLDIEYNKIKIK